MTCLDFVNSIGYENFKNSITDYFDHMMAFYRLCGTCYFESISSVVNNDMVDFNIIFANYNDIYTLTYILGSSSTNIINVFNRDFIYEYEQIDTVTLRVKIRPSVH